MSEKSVWIVGHHAVQAVLRVNPERVLALYLVDQAHNDAQQQIRNMAAGLGLTLQQIDKKTLSRRCGSEQHQGVAVQARPVREGDEKQLKAFVQGLDEPFLLILDQVQDPHNFGACLRTADAAGVDAVIVAKDNASPMTATVQKVASGAAQTMPVFRVTNLARAMQSLQALGVWMIGTSDKADHSLYQQKLQGALAIVMGAEGKGLRQLTGSNCDALVKLPMAGGVVSSLNVSVATGICLYEAVRQRQSSTAGK